MGDLPGRDFCGPLGMPMEGEWPGWEEEEEEDKASLDEEDLGEQCAIALIQPALYGRRRRRRMLGPSGMNVPGASRSPRIMGMGLLFWEGHGTSSRLPLVEQEAGQTGKGVTIMKSMESTTTILLLTIPLLPPTFPRTAWWPDHAARSFALSPSWWAPPSLRSSGGRCGAPDSP